MPPNQKMSKAETIEANLKAHKQRPDISYFKSLDASIKKNSAFVKKLSTISSLPKDQKVELAATLKSLNFKRYVAEAVKAIAELSFSLEDVDYIVELCCVLHQNYDEFTNAFLKELTKTQEDIGKLRIVIRLYAEFLSFKICLDSTVLYNLISNIVDKTDETNLAQNASTILEMVKANPDLYLEQKFTVKIDEIYEKVMNTLKSTDDVKKQGKLFNVSKPLSEILKKEIVEVKKQEVVKLTVNLPEKFDTEDARAFYEDIVKLDEVVYEKIKEQKDLSGEKKEKTEAEKEEDDLYKKLNFSVTSKVMTVEWAGKFFALRGNKKKLAKWLFGVNRTSLELIPLYSRLACIMNQREITKELQKDLLDEFETLFKVKNQNIESKIKNIRFIGEMCKFKLISRGTVISLLGRMLETPEVFSGHVVEVTYHLLETCGRYVYATEGSHETMKDLLDKMWRYKEVRNYDVKYILLMENCYFLSKGEKTAEEKQPPLWLYLENIIFGLARENIRLVLEKLTKFPDYTMVHKILRDPRCRYSHLPLIASMVFSLSVRDEFFGVMFVDQLLQDIRNSMDSLAFANHQKRLLDIRLLGELYNYQLLEPEVIFETLYMFVCYAPENDLPQDTFRIRLICTLLDCVMMHSDSLPHLETFIHYLQNYILKKGMRLPIDVEFMLADTLERLKPDLKWPRDLADSQSMVESLSEPEILPGDRILWEIGKKKRVVIKKDEISVNKTTEVKIEKKKDEFDMHQLDRELHQMMEESLNQRKLEVPRLRNTNKPFIVLKPVLKK